MGDCRARYPSRDALAGDAASPRSTRAANGCVAPMIREPLAATPTSPVALLLP
jgi:hypothetical protein